jgi:hypothetical protein
MADKKWPSFLTHFDPRPPEKLIITLPATQAAVVKACAGKLLKADETKNDELIRTQISHIFGQLIAQYLPREEEFERESAPKAAREKSPAADKSVDAQRRVEPVHPAQAVA